RRSTRLNGPLPTGGSMQRRTFIKLTGVAGILAAHRAPAFAQGSKVYVVRWVDFIPEADVELKRQAPEASKALGAEVQFEFINANDLQPRITAGIQSGSGADIFQMLYNWPQLYANGKPVGQALGHSFGDPPTFAYAFLWSYGGAETDPSGKRVVINSKGTVESVKFLQAFWKDACDEGGLAWDDTNNNRAFHAGEISATLNGASIYIVAKRQKDKIKDEKGEPLFQDIEHAALMPKGPAGQFALYLPFQHSVMKYSKNQKLAKDFLKWLHQDANYGKWFEVNEGYSVGAAKKWEDHPMWARVDKPLQVFRQAARLTRAFGHPGPASAKATESYTKYVIVDMYAKAVQGMKAEDAVKWAEGELKKIYEA